MPDAVVDSQCVCVCAAGLQYLAVCVFVILYLTSSVIAMASSPCDNQFKRYVFPTTGF